MKWPEGRAIYTAMLNARGGFESDLTVLRLSNETYRLYVGSGAVKRDMAWLRRHIDGERVTIQDVTEDYAVLGLMGPEASAIAGRLGASGLEGLGFAVSRDGGFIGADALRRAREDGVKPRMVSILLDDADAWPLGNEPVYRDGEIIGQTTSAAWGYRAGHHVALAFLKPGLAQSLDGERVQVDVARKMFAEPSRSRLSSTRKADACVAASRPVRARAFRPRQWPHRRVSSACLRP